MDGLDAEGAVMLICPVQVPAVKPVVFTCTVNVLGVAPEVCDKTIQLPPHVAVLAAAVKLTLAPVLMVMESD